MPNTYDLITTQTLGSSSATISVFIPTGYTDIQLRISLRSTRAADVDNLYMYFNSDNNTANYNRLLFYDESGTLGSEISQGTSSSQQIGAIPAANLVGSLFNVGLIDLINYASSARKSYNTFTSMQRTGGPARYIWNQYNNWTGTATISTVVFLASFGSIAAGSSVSVYGIKKA